ncbi:hypothetical protein RIF29_07016 [Crotalaria pallida]|uniref:Uncharacterized protein n=1 Tax=Crotalaria pallida TaxID=3830 RepID=A0AAN9PB78_CROPI
MEALSSDALAKAKNALQMQKDLAEKLKKIPQKSISLDELNTVAEADSYICYYRRSDVVLVICKMIVR